MDDKISFFTRVQEIRISLDLKSERIHNTRILFKSESNLCVSFSFTNIKSRDIRYITDSVNGNWTTVGRKNINTENEQ